MASYAEGTGCPAGAVLAEGPITIDLDTTDVEVYDRKKHGGTGSVHGTRAPLTLTTPANTMRDWITTGRAFMRGPGSLPPSSACGSTRSAG